ncbi:flagellar biosynthesis protein FlhF [Exiguobacterium sp. KRL4]|uniref:flagellar biosynthesis protein FlhF n=1 Tax=Exiguobacterium sp. KRL4 TaxID=1914536 RepID=UPI0008F906F9|nr:flagellar biosynthesis protein FlhF [Exiguobacterium sp. KRL4]OIN67909.1 flagellar biosynthesis protein FlhF [Exiguobacterium sp. KRL4]
MMVKRIIANSVSEAMELVKQDLGEEAIILNTRQIKVGGVFGLFTQKKVELVASVEEHPVARPKKQPLANPEPVSVPPTARLHGVVNSGMTEQVTPTVVSFASRRLPEALERYDVLLAEPALQRCAEELHDLMLSTYYKTNDVTQVEQALVEAVEKEIQITTATSRFVMLTGPTGVGKTTTIAKLAAYYRLTKQQTVGLITTDTYRISAIEQLRTYADIIDIPLRVAYDLEEFEQAKTELADCDIILIDTAGRNFLDAGYVEQLKARHDFSDTDVFLVLSLTSKYRDLEQIRKRFGQVPLSGFIFTKADETTELWSIYGLTRETRIPVFCLTTGQEVPEDIIWPTSPEISQMIVERGLR